MSALTDTEICNFALQKLGAKRIGTLVEATPNARSMNACYAIVRDSLLRSYRWNFARIRVTLAPDPTAPAFDFDYAFPVPSDFLRLLSPNISGNYSSDGGRNDVDWRIENHHGKLAILTNDGDSINVIYLARITDTTLYDPLFVTALGWALAHHTCEEITQSNQKKADMAAGYKDAIALARKVNAFETQPGDPPIDTFLTARL